MLLRSSLTLRVSATRVPTALLLMLAGAPGLILQEHALGDDVLVVLLWWPFPWRLLLILRFSRCSRSLARSSLCTYVLVAGSIQGLAPAVVKQLGSLHVLPAHVSSDHLANDLVHVEVLEA